MTEAEWLACVEPIQMIVKLPELGLRFTDRKWRLFACGCCRRVWDALTDERSRRAVEYGERHADGLGSRPVLLGIQTAAAERDAELTERFPVSLQLLQAYVRAMPERAAARAAAQVAHPDPDEQWVAFALGVAELTSIAPPEQDARYGPERRCQSELLRCVLGNPFRSARVDAAWLTWNDGTVKMLAQDIYEERAFERLPILADALEEAGCADAGLLAHCRGPGPHARGCWVVDLLLGKQ